MKCIFFLRILYTFYPRVGFFPPADRGLFHFDRIVPYRYPSCRDSFTNCAFLFHSGRSHRHLSYDNHGALRRFPPKPPKNGKRLSGSGNAWLYISISIPSADTSITMNQSNVLMLPTLIDLPNLCSVVRRMKNFVFVDEAWV